MKDKNNIMLYLVIILSILCIADLSKLAENLVLGVLVVVMATLMALCLWVMTICFKEIKQEIKPKKKWKKPDVVRQLDEAFDKKVLNSAKKKK